MIKKSNGHTSMNNQLELIDMIKLNTILFDTPASERAKTQLIKEELSTGRYQINSHHIADKLLEFAPITEEIEMA